MSKTIPLNELFEGGPLFIDPKQKVQILFRASGNTPQVKQDKVMGNHGKPFSLIVQHLRRLLRLQNHEHLYIYVQQAFAPDENMMLGDLYTNFGIDGSLTLYYSTAPIWG